MIQASKRSHPHRRPGSGGAAPPRVQPPPLEYVGSSASAATGNHVPRGVAAGSRLLHRPAVGLRARPDSGSRAAPASGRTQRRSRLHPADQFRAHGRGRLRHLGQQLAELGGPRPPSRLPVPVRTTAARTGAPPSAPHCAPHSAAPRWSACPSSRRTPKLALRSGPGDLVSASGAPRVRHRGQLLSAYGENAVLVLRAAEPSPVRPGASTSRDPPGSGALNR